MMFVEETGNPVGPPMVLVHGFLSSNAQWDLNRDELGKHYRLLMVELLGHGRSDAPDDPDAYGIDALLAELESIRIERHIETWWVCGQSLGGAISILYCLAHPERVRGLVFTNTRAALASSARACLQTGASHQRLRRHETCLCTRSMPRGCPR